MQTVPEIGQIVIVRNRPFVVREVVPSTDTFSKENLRKNHLVKMNSVEDDGFDEQMEVIWELELGTKIHEKSTLPEPNNKFDTPIQFQAFLNAVRWGAISQSQENILHSPFRSGIRIDDYQLDPLVRALTMPRVNLLIADDVGLGKTIETGMIVQELILRHRIRSILVLCPSSLQNQWKEEMRDKFGLEFRIIDRDSIAALRRKRGIHVNPWTHFPRLITSIDYIKRDHALRRFSESLPSGGKPTYPRAFDLLIIDEAHNVAPSGRGKYATESLRTQAVRTLTPHFEHKIFLSATPHNGYPESFTALLEMLDNQRFARAVTPDKDQLHAIMIRRLKSELKQNLDGSLRFAEREVKHIEVDYTEDEKQAHKHLDEYTKLRSKNASNQRNRFITEFVLVLLKKRMISSPAAFATSLAKHKDSIGMGGQHKNLDKIIEDYKDEYESETDNDEEYEIETENVIGITSQPLPELTDREKELLDELYRFAENAVKKPDSKTKKLIEWLNELLRPDGKWNNKRIIIFTEYRATQMWLYDQLAHAGFAKSNRTQLIYGGMPNEDREKIKAAFQAHPDDSQISILLATDAASEGINLQNHCNNLLHFEIPWNPNRMEQRNGRVDRHGQKAKSVNIYHFVSAGFDSNQGGTSSEGLAADLDFLRLAIKKVETIREDLGKVGPVIAKKVEKAMLGQRTSLDDVQSLEKADPISRMFTVDRKLSERLSEITTKLENTKDTLRLSPTHTKNLVDLGLKLAEQPSLIPQSISSNSQNGELIDEPLLAYELPNLSENWLQCTEGLLHPHTEKKRPIVFDSKFAEGRDDVVYAHLNHKLVQMCMRLLRAEIWYSKSLSRISACISKDKSLANPIVVTYGRIVVLGGDNHRIHEELISAGGTLIDGQLKRLNEGDLAKVIDSVSENEPDADSLELVESIWPKIGENLLSFLNARTNERTKTLESRLGNISETEVKKIETVMNELSRSIKAELEEIDDPQFKMQYEDDAQGFHQVDLDIKSLRDRLESIPLEIEKESEYIRSRYSNPEPKLFPVAVNWIFPQN